MYRIYFITNEGLIKFNMDVDIDTTIVTIKNMTKAILESDTEVEVVRVDGIEIEVCNNRAIAATEVALAWEFCVNTKRKLINAAYKGTLDRVLNQMYLEDKI